MWSCVKLKVFTVWWRTVFTFRWPCAEENISWCRGPGWGRSILPLLLKKGWNVSNSVAHLLPISFFSIFWFTSMSIEAEKDLKLLMLAWIPKACFVSKSFFCVYFLLLFWSFSICLDTRFEVTTSGECKSRRVLALVVSNLKDLFLTGPSPKSFSLWFLGTWFLRPSMFKLPAEFSGEGMIWSS